MWFEKLMGFKEISYEFVQQNIEIKENLLSKGIQVKANSDPVLAEEAPGAYKNVDQVVKTSDKLGIAKLVAKVSPLIVTKG